MTRVSRLHVKDDDKVCASFFGVQFSKVIGFVFNVVQKEHSEIMMFIREGRTGADGTYVRLQVRGLPQDGQ